MTRCRFFVGILATAIARLPGFGEPGAGCCYIASGKSWVVGVLNSPGTGNPFKSKIDPRAHPKKFFGL